MSDFAHTLAAVAPWAGLTLLGLIFLANAFGVLDQSVAVRELTAAGVREPWARLMVGGGRLMQLLATPCLFFHATRPYAAILLAVFLVGATLTAHVFWRTPSPAHGERDRQLANFLKNAAIIGGLLLALSWND